MTNSLFRGDVVRVVRSPYRSVLVGAAGIVRYCYRRYPNDKLVRVMIDGGEDWSFWPYELELVK